MTPAKQSYTNSKYWELPPPSIRTRVSLLKSRLCCISAVLRKLYCILTFITKSSTVYKDKCFAHYGFGWCVEQVVDEDCQNPGGNFVEVSLCVVVKQAAGTLIAFEVEYPHETPLVFAYRIQLLTTNKRGV